MSEIPVEIEAVLEAIELLRSAAGVIDSEWNFGGDEFREAATRLQRALDASIPF